MPKTHSNDFIVKPEVLSNPIIEEFFFDNFSMRFVPDQSYYAGSYKLKNQDFLSLISDLGKKRNDTIKERILDVIPKLRSKLDADDNSCLQQAINIFYTNSLNTSSSNLSTDDHANEIWANRFLVGLINISNGIYVNRNGEVRIVSIDDLTAAKNILDSITDNTLKYKIRIFKEISKTHKVLNESNIKENHNSIQSPDTISFREIVRREYLDALQMLGSYYGAQAYYAKSWEKYSRFFSGAWNRKNISSVKEVVEDHDPYGLNEGKKDGTVESLLNDLKEKLVSSPEKLNPNGALMKIVDNIQKKYNINIIRIEEINTNLVKRVKRI